MSSIYISFNLPDLYTLDFILDDSSCNLLKAASLPYSDIDEIKEARNTATRIPIVSYISKSLNKKRILIANAIKSILIIGSANDSKNNLKKLFFFNLVILFDPYFFLCFVTSSLVKPFI